MGPAIASRTPYRVPVSHIAAFTIIEVLVALGVVSIIAAVVLSGNASFNQSVLLTQAAYSVAGTIREAQSLGVSNRGTNAGYGVSINVGTSGSGTSSYTLFSDFYPSQWNTYETCYPGQDPELPNAKPGNCKYDAQQNEYVRTYTLTRGIKVTAVCGQLNDPWGTYICTQITDSAQTCVPWSEGGIDGVEIVFARPNTEAKIYGINYHYTNMLFATLVLQDPSGAARYVTVRDTGQVSVHASCP